MKRLVLVLTMLSLICACGGGNDQTSTAGTPNPDETNYAPDDDTPNEEPADTDEGLPAIVDNYYDYGSFTYEDVSLYEGAYMLVVDPEKTCSDFFSITMQDSMTLSSVTDYDLDALLEDVPHAFLAASREEMGDGDILGYTGTYRDRVCAIVIGSYSLIDVTSDLFGFACVTDDLSDYCAETYERTSDYDFSGRTIKSVGSERRAPDLTAEALRLLRPSL